MYGSCYIRHHADNIRLTFHESTYLLHQQMVLLVLGSQEETLELALEVGSKDVLTDGRTYLVKRPETSAVKLFSRRTHRTIVGGTVDIDELPLTAAVEDVLPYPYGLEIADTQLFAHLTDECLLWILAVIHVAAYAGVPLARLNVLPLRTLLQIYLALRIKHMQMNHRVQQPRTVVTLATGSGAYDLP